MGPSVKPISVVFFASSWLKEGKYRHKVADNTNKHFHEKECTRCFIDIRFSFPMVWIPLFNLDQKGAMHNKRKRKVKLCISIQLFYSHAIPIKRFPWFLTGNNISMCSIPSSR